ncbi:MAG TPA: metallophosphoesterase family protein [Ktedonobacterales bacterium]|nr:metallophosphoesterase family protein [Ktedonobacterales bacterium]
MRYVILADIHGNYEALTAVLRDVEEFVIEQRTTIDEIWCLGDIVGYGPQPSECVRTVSEYCAISIAGNHDWAAIGKLDLDEFTGVAANSAEWTSEQLTPQERIYLRQLPDRARSGLVTLVHGSPLNPIWEYLTTPLGATPNFSAFDTTFCLIGHTHVPTIFLLPDDAPPMPPAPFQLSGTRMPGGFDFDSGELMPFPSLEPLTNGPLCEQITPTQALWVLPEHRRAIINPGSVGQPRDGDPRAAYLIYDTDVGFEFRRVEYDIAATQRRMAELGLSPRMAARLAHGV